MKIKLQMLYTKIIVLWETDTATPVTEKRKAHHKTQGKVSIKAYLGLFFWVWF